MPRSARRPRLTEAERDARRQADRERVEQAARALLTSDGWRRWIKVRASNGLSRYSLKNQLLIAIDCHNRGITPTYVAGFRAFLALNRCVRQGEKAIHILAPITVKQRDDHGEPTAAKKMFFRAVPVFDVSMTDPLPDREPVPLAPPSEPITGDSHRHLIVPLIAHAATLGYQVEIRELPEHGPGGWCDPAQQRITVAAGPRQPPSPRPGARARPRPRPRLPAIRPRALRSARRLRHLLRTRLTRPRYLQRNHPLHRRLGRRRRARRHSRLRQHDRHHRPPHRKRAHAGARPRRRSDRR